MCRIVKMGKICDIYTNITISVIFYILKLEDAGLGQSDRGGEGTKIDNIEHVFDRNIIIIIQSRIRIN